MIAILLLHLALGVGIVASGDRLGRRAFLLAAVAPAATLVWAATQWSGVVDGTAVTQQVEWVAGLDLALDLRLDAFGLVMVSLVSGIGLLVCWYAHGYFSHPKPGTARLAGLMTLFAGAMLGVVTADHLLALFVFWELTSVTSYLLIGNDDTNPRARAAALQAIVITGAGGLAMLLGLVIIGEAADTYLLSELLADPPTGGAVPAGLVLVLLGAFTKSAQFPFGSWLPGAMVAPTPISAYLHSATMVKAGVYLVARLAPIFAAVTVWRPLVLVVGSVTMLVGGLRALRQHDLKLLLAYGTVSQLGFLMLLLGTGAYKIAQAGVVLLLAHGAFKAALFMVVGIVDHEIGTRDVRAIPRLAGAWRPVQVIAVLSAASMAGLPPLLGFIAKEKAFAGYEVATFGGADVVLAVIVVGSILTFTYSARFVLGVLGRLEDDEHRLADAHPHDPPVAFWAPAAVLTAFTVAAGVAPVVVDALVQAATLALDPAASPSDVVLWAGFGLPVVLSIVVIAVGTLLAVAGRWVAEVQRRLSAPLAHLPTTEQAFLSGLKGTTAFATRLTARVQHGSLPLYLAVVLTTVLVLPVVVLVGAGFEWPELVDVAVQVPLVAIIVAGAVGAALMRRRIAAALMLGAIGYAMAGLYIVQGAPDLALTQLAIETLFTVLFVLVLRFLPPRFVDRTPVIVRSFRLGASLLVGAAVFVMMLVAASGRDDVAEPSVSQEMIERAAPEAKGNNVTNVILVDFRGLDTLGEIAVLLVAAVGAVGLARLGRRRPAPESEVPS